jgi:hypothetical protein
MSFGPNGPSLVASGAIVAPVAAAALVSAPLTIVEPGTYALVAQCAMAPYGTIAKEDAGNAGIYKNNVLLATVPSGAAGEGPSVAFNVAAAAGDVFTMKAVANATAALTYASTLAMTLLSSVAG